MTGSAMTKEQWAAWLSDEARTQIEDPNGNVAVIVRAVGGDVPLAGGTHHAIAACALHNKPFGFTQADVNALDQLTRGELNESRSRDGIESIRDRVAALVAPQS